MVDNLAENDFRSRDLGDFFNQSPDKEKNNTACGIVDGLASRDALATDIRLSPRKFFMPRYLTGHFIKTCAKKSANHQYSLEQLNPDRHFETCDTTSLDNK